MNSYENPNKHPEFGRSISPDLFAPTHEQANSQYQDHYWNPPSHHVNALPGFQSLGSSHSLQTPLLHYHHENGQNTHVQTGPGMTWNQGLTDLDHLSNTDELTNFFSQERQATPSPRAHQISPQEYPPSPAPKVINLNRPQLAKAEPDSRPARLNEYKWQKKYHKDQLLNIYWKVFSKWGCQKRFTATDSLFARISQHFERFPDQAEMYLLIMNTSFKRQQKKPVTRTRFILMQILM